MYDAHMHKHTDTHMRYLKVSCFLLYLVFYLFEVLHTYSMMDVQVLLQVGRIEPLRGNLALITVGRNLFMRIQGKVTML